MVRGILSASFPVIAVIFSPTFIKGNAQVSQTVAEREKNTGCSQSGKHRCGSGVKKTERGAGMNPVAVAIQVSRGG